MMMMMITIMTTMMLIIMISMRMMTNEEEEEDNDDSFNDANDDHDLLTMAVYWTRLSERLGYATPHRRESTRVNCPHRRDRRNCRSCKDRMILLAEGQKSTSQVKYSLSHIYQS
ncbi:hypothetical protein ElyMa_006310100 [Elysia marginata]|uniref:Secreted protein n=1 Tax=Elysia marginata TaxID=1093978 RepID=A0AAV4HIJ3_9GAST|nr:hypothetical protein ElyMa_006310100 [Elysia marginata]